MPDNNSEQRKKLNKIIRDIKENPPHVSFDDGDSIYAYGLITRDRVIELRELAASILPRDIITRLSEINVDVELNDLTPTSEAMAKLRALVPAIEDALSESIADFSSRFGFETEREIVHRTTAPPELRSKIVDIAYGAGMAPRDVRETVCRCLCVAPNFRTGNNEGMIAESRNLLAECVWHDVYNVIEAIYEDLAPDGREHFEKKINTVFRQEGIGWQLVAGKITHRGEEPFQVIAQAALEQLEHADLKTGGEEFLEAIGDLSHRPVPKLSGALAHAYNAVECVMQSVCGENGATLGKLIDRHKGTIPPPLDSAVRKLWGYASQYGRHRTEGKNPRAEEAELAVHVAAAVVTYLSKKAMVD